MLVRVLIERHIKEGNVTEAADKILEMRKQATTFPGYVSGETLTDTADPRTVIIVSTWHSREEWEKWDSSPEHKAAARALEPLLDGNVSVRAFVNPWDALLDS
jgi:heme-degrading monooxygenase HmoA